MFRVSVMYAGKDGGKFDYDYYAKTHMALVRERLGSFGLPRTEVDKGLAGDVPGQAPPYVCTGHLYWHSLDDFQKGMKAHGQGADGRRAQLHQPGPADADQRDPHLRACALRGRPGIERSRKESSP